MADEVQDGDLTPEGDASDTSANQGDDGLNSGDRKRLEELSKEDLAGYLRELRKENKKRREENARIQKQVGALPELMQKLLGEEDSEEVKEKEAAERLIELEEAAGRVPGLERYSKHVEGIYGERMKGVEEMDEAVQGSINNLLEDMPEDDFLGRLKVIDAVLAVSGTKEKESAGDMSADDTGNPAETGDGESSKTLADDLAYSPQGMQEAALAGLVKSKSE